MRRGWLFLLAALAFALAGCEFREETRETGHKGKAKANPYLAAERFLENYDFPSGDGVRWPEFDPEDVMVVVPLPVLEAVGREAEVKRWVAEGGHLVVLLRHGEPGFDDWSPRRWQPPVEEGEMHAYSEWLAEAGMKVAYEEKESVEQLRFEGERYEVFVESDARVSSGKHFVSKRWGEGRLTVMASARPFRNRHIGEHDHAELLLALADSTEFAGRVTFLRFVTESFWALIWEKAWPFLVALVALTGVWLWRNLPRFGPVDSAETSKTLLASDHHLEALGGFHWGLDRGRALLAPLRESLMERAHRLALASGRPDDDLFQLIAERAGLPRDRTERAMTVEVTRDSASFTRLTADLQQIHHSLP